MPRLIMSADSSPPRSSAHASGINDGAGALLMSEAEAARRGNTPLAGSPSLALTPI
ncbi:hypothetical protein [Sinorhizobium mexicanum]|uniref:hypothetical protein n=1 Tax=Sinorhizobium mexicanum TaxID=375549 RepID=UPI0015DE4084|nr:hypothetical protein [Sinorhizobium mexicanum]MBP1884777.1 acetyl-CoA acetyltransferase [Sinorhizobium mexicanum]